MSPWDGRVRRSSSCSSPAIASIDFVMPKPWRSRQDGLSFDLRWRTSIGERGGPASAQPLRARPTLGRALCFLVVTCLAAAGCQQEIRPRRRRKTDGARSHSPPGPVVPAAETTVARTAAATGTLAADEQVVLGTKVVGRLAEISVDLGSLVKKGQPIARRHPGLPVPPLTRRSPARRPGSAWPRPTAMTTALTRPRPPWCARRRRCSTRPS